ncbi:hypothetical protein ACHAQH_007902 [Verticillium albo-atrum]
MASHITPAKFAAAAAVALPAIVLVKHALQIYANISAAPRQGITEFDVNPESFLQSVTVTRHVNPNRHVALHDCRHISVQIPEHARSMSDEALLAAFVRGFFGGKVFAPERTLLKIVKLDLLNYPDLKRSASAAHVWDVNQLEGDELLPLSSIYFGGFQISDIHVHQPDHVPDRSAETESNIDFVFGSSQGNFSGSHRFSVLRTESDPTSIRIRSAHTSCNPTGDKLSMPDFMGPLHNFYAMVLFREAVGEVKRRLGS